MVASVLDKLLETLDVRLHAFAVLQVERGYRLLSDPMDAVVIHYVLAGSGVLQVGERAPAPFGPHCILIVPPHESQSLSSSTHSVRDVLASESSMLLADGLLKFTAGAGEGEILIVCGTISATYRGAFGLFDHLAGPLVESIAGVERLRDAFDALFVELADPGIGTRALTEALMKQCLILLLRHISLSAASTLRCLRCSRTAAVR